VAWQLQEALADFTLRANEHDHNGYTPDVSIKDGNKQMHSLAINIICLMSYTRTFANGSAIERRLKPTATGRE
jgi:hypothetical protein